MTPDHATWNPKRWLPELESLRGLAAFAVVLHHAARDSFGPQGGPLVTLAAWLGGWGVTFFFVLSGFCIHLPRARELARGQDVSLDTLAFWRQRARRLLPTHYASLALTCLVALRFESHLIGRPTTASLLQHLFMVHVWTSAFYSINAVFWSIAVEVHFYLSYPLYLQARRRIGTPALTLALLFMGLATYGAGSVLFPAGNPARVIVQSLFLVSWWQWSLGALLAEVYVRAQAAPLTRLFSFRGALPFWLACSLGLAFVDPTFVGMHLRQWILPPTCALLLARTITVEGAWSKNRALGLLGSFSYSLYLVHPVAQAVLLAYLPPEFGIASVAAASAASLLAAWLFFLAFERPLLKKRAHDVQETAASTTQAAGAANSIEFGGTSSLSPSARSEPGALSGT